jgi:hypothetical protein
MKDPVASELPKISAQLDAQFARLNATVASVQRNTRCLHEFVIADGAAASVAMFLGILAVLILL